MSQMLWFCGFGFGVFVGLFCGRVRSEVARVIAVLADKVNNYFLAIA